MSYRPMGKKDYPAWRKRPSFLYEWLAGGAVCLVVLGVVFLGRPYDIEGRALAPWWSREVFIDGWLDGAESGECEYCFGVKVPDGARDVKRWTSTYTTTDERCSGTGATRRCYTTTKYHTVCHASWRIYRFRPKRSVEANKFDREPQWPTFELSPGGAPMPGVANTVMPEGKERENRRVETYSVTFVCKDGKRRELRTDQQTWSGFDKGETYKIHVGWFGSTRGAVAQ